METSKTRVWEAEVRPFRPAKTAALQPGVEAVTGFGRSNIFKANIASRTILSEYYPTLVTVELEIWFS
jgi:hypothetical protein